jgi:xanthine dehydrogenase iron-sulfur cluster and FAD-binding subunit A
VGIFFVIVIITAATATEYKPLHDFAAFMAVRVSIFSKVHLRFFCQKQRAHILTS